MPAQVLHGKIILLPALPGAWPDGEMTGAKLPGKISPSIRREKGRLISAELDSPKERRLTVCYLETEREICLKAGESFKMVFTL